MNSDKKNPVRLKWKSDIINWDQLSNEAAVFVVQQGETVLNECVETARTISAKADRLISILLPLASAIMLYLISGTPLHHNQFLKISGLLILMVMLISLCYCYKNFRHYQIAIPGLYPKDMLTSRIINTTFTERQQYLTLVFNVCENIQQQIEINAELNQARTNNNRLAIKWLFAIPFCPMVVALVLFVVYGFHFVLPWFVK